MWCWSSLICKLEQIKLWRVKFRIQFLIKHPLITLSVHYWGLHMY
jgi:hypothetical protein